MSSVFVGSIKSLENLLWAPWICFWAPWVLVASTPLKSSSLLHFSLLRLCWPCPLSTGTKFSPASALLLDFLRHPNSPPSGPTKDRQYREIFRSAISKFSSNSLVYITYSPLVLSFSGHSLCDFPVCFTIQVPLLRTELLGFLSASGSELLFSTSSTHYDAWTIVDPSFAAVTAFLFLGRPSTGCKSVLCGNFCLFILQNIFEVSLWYWTRRSGPQLSL